MAEIDTRPLEPVREVVTLFEPRSDRRLNGLISPGRNAGSDTQQEEEITILTEEVSTCKLSLQVKETETAQAVLKLEALLKAMQELSDKYDRACLDSHGRIAELEAENRISRQSSETAADECEALRAELAVVKGELDAAKATSIAGALREVEARAVAERESTKKALTRILQLNESVLSSAVAAVRAEEERSVFFQEVTLELFDSDKNLEVIRRQGEAVEGMERELLAKTVEIEYLRAELNQTRERYVSSSREVSDDATADDIGGCRNLQEDCQVIPPSDGEHRHTDEDDHGQQPPDSDGVLHDSKDEFYTKELELDPEQGRDELKLDGGRVLDDPGQGAAAKGEADADAANDDDKLLDAARAEISDLRFSLEEAVRRAELAEEAKAALERELREEIRNKHPSRRRAASDSEDGSRRPAREGPPPPKPSLPLQMQMPPGGEGLPTPRCVPLGKVLNMKYK